jgi:hypothetical protein
MSVSGVDFDIAWQNQQKVAIGDSTVRFISKEDLILTKKAAGRARDLADLELLQIVVKK